jgi:hypothetical protein
MPEATKPNQRRIQLAFERLRAVAEDLRRMDYNGGASTLETECKVLERAIPQTTNGS